MRKKLLTIGLWLTVLMVNAGINNGITPKTGTHPTGIRRLYENRIIRYVLNSGLAGNAEMDVWGNGNSISSGDVTPTLADFTDFDSLALCNGKVSHTFFIVNTGTDSLYLTGNPVVSITGANASDFTLGSALPDTVIAPGDTTTFTIGFVPSFVGLHTATVSIINDDSDENPYTFDIQGVGTPDVTPPSVFCHDTTIFLDASGSFTIDSSYIDNGSMDSCGIATMHLNRYTFTCADVPSSPLRVTMVVTDNSGNRDSCTSFVTVVDNLPPAVVCQSITTYLDAGGQSVVYPIEIGLSGSDNCGIGGAGIVQFTPVPQPVNNAVTSPGNGLGQTFTAPANGVITSISVFADNDYSGLNLNIYNGASGSGISGNVGSPAYVQPGVNLVNSVGGTVATVVNLSSPFNVTAGNQYSFVLDGTAFSLYFNSSDVYAGGAYLENYADFTTSGDLQFDVQIAEFKDSLVYDCSNLGANNAALVVFDGSGNMANCLSVITVSDTIHPVAVCQNITVYLDASGNAAITGNDLDNGSSDNCSIVSYTATPNAFNCSDAGSNVVRLLVTDASGNTDSCFATVTVTDTISPVILCMADTVLSNDAGNCSAVFNYTVPSFTDNCAGGSVSQTGGLPSGSAFPVGTTTNTFVVTDAGGNTDTCSFTVTVNDTELPILTGCPSDITVSNDAGNCDAVVSWTVPAPSDNCAGVMMASSHTPGSTFPVGTTLVKYIVTDAAGNQDSCQFNVIVNDDEDPLITCINDTTLSNDAGLCSAVVNFSATFSDNCPGTTVSFVPASGSAFPVGTTLVTATATDASGNTAQCTFNVIVNDTEAPVISCPGNTVVSNDPGNCTATVSYTLPSFTDNCSGGSISQIAGLPSGSVFPSGTTTNTYVATDAAGNTDTCTFTITVNDTENPMALCQNVTVYVNSGGSATLVPIQVNNGSADNCGITLMTVAPSTFDCNDIGSPVPVTLTVEDAAGNSSTCIANITVADTIKPTAICQNITVNLSGPGTVTITPAMVNNGSFDNCSVSSLSVYPSVFSCTDTGPNVVTLVVTDASGNRDSCFATVTVNDVTPPVAVCQNITANLDATGNLSITPAMINNGSADACGIDTMYLNVYDFNCTQVGANSVNLTVADVNGNTNTCIATVTVQDVTSPVAVCQNVTVYLDGIGNTTVTASALNNGSADACGIASFSASPSSFNCSNLGSNNVTLTVMDINGNSSTCTAVVTVLDTIAPAITCPGNMIVNNDPGNCDAVVTYTAPSVADNCSGNTVTQIAGLSSGATFPPGTTTNTFVAADGDGNTDTCSFTVTVIDTEIPVADCQPVTVYLDATGNASVTASQINNNSSDNCSISSISASPTTFNCSNLGGNNVMLTVTDVNGNVGTCNASVTVLDTIRPTATAPANVNVNTDNGLCSASGVNLGMPVTSDNCAVTSITNNNPGTYPVGVTTVTWLVADQSGNNITVTQTVTVTDNEAPNVICRNDTVILDGSGNGSITAMDINNGSADNCGIASYTVHPALFDCSAIGNNNVWLVVTDIHGNADSCMATVVVIDTVQPVIMAPANVTASANPGSCYATGVVLGSPIASANCGSFTVTNDAPSMFPVGVTTVTWTVIDQSNNTSTITQTVTVTDDEYPVITNVPSDIAVTNTAGMCGAVVTWQAPLASDNCYNLNFSSNYSSGSTFPIGTTMVVYTATDGSGNVVTASFNVTVTDTEDPAIMNVPGNITINNAAGLCSGIATWTSPFATDNCPGVVLSSNFSSGSSFPVGTTTVIYTATDVYGNSATASFTVTVNDTEAPVLSVVNDTLNVISGTCAAAGNSITPPAAMDNCGISTMVNNASSPVPVGTHIITWTVTDIHGNTSTINQTVVVVDNEAPVIVPAPDVTDSVNAAGCTATGVSLGVPSYGDNCGVLNVSNNAPVNYPVGTTVVTWTVTDIHGNVSTATQLVTINALPSPVIGVSALPNDTVCAGSQLTLNGSGASAYSWSGGVTDNVPFTISSAGTYTVTASDAYGCTGTATISIFVNGAPNVGYTSLPGDTVCDHTPVTLSGTGAQSYTWSGGISDGAPFTVSGAMTFTVTGTDTLGCSNTAIAHIYGRSLALGYIIAPDDTVCSGTEVTVSGTGGSGYTWTGGVADGVPFVVTADMSLLMTATDTNGCAGSLTLDIVALPAPVVNLGPDIYAASGPVMLDAGNPGAASHIWNGTANTQVIYVNNSGLYVVEVTNADGCSASDTISVFIQWVGVEENPAPDATVYPNPNNGIFTLSLTDVPEGKIVVHLADNLGRIVLAEQMVSDKQVFDVSYLAAGTYYLHIRTSLGDFVKPIVIKQNY